MTNISRYKKDLEKLISQSVNLYYSLAYEIAGETREKNRIKKMIEDNKAILVDFRKDYEKWYSEALEVIKQILPSRLDDFKYLYKNEKRKELNRLTYNISDYMIGIKITRPNYTIVDEKSAFPKFEQQKNILKAVEQRFESSLFEIKQLLQADLFDSELDTARELLKNGYIRAAGAITGVVLEKHLSLVSDNHDVIIKAKNPSIADYNNELKEAQVLDIPTWRYIQHLADLRNLCDHSKQREPKTEEIEDLINGVDKITKTVF